MQRPRLSRLLASRPKETSSLENSPLNPRKVRIETGSDPVINHKRKESPRSLPPLNISYERILPIIRDLQSLNGLLRSRWIPPKGINPYGAIIIETMDMRLTCAKA